jgi:hypothetical protein
MTNNDELALKLKAAAEKATPGEWHKGRQDHVTGIIKVYARTGSIKLNCIAKTDAHEVGFGISEREHRGNAELISLANPANILALLAERDADKKRIEMLERYVNERDAQNQDLLLNIGSLQQRIAELREYYEGVIADGSKRIAELEERTVSVKLPKPHAHLIWIQAGRGPDDYWDDVAVSHSLKDRCCDGSERYPVYSIFEIQEACAAAGIKLDVGE